ncbi:hypothetical protein H4R35_000279 [Dimargaris xerosporica]|nr:hypothetical protein H4R35_000279 [Dimargaris xerosporica]
MATLMAHWQVSKGCLKRHYPQIVVEVHNDVTDECTPKHLPMASLTNSQGLAPALTIALCLGHNQSINVEARFACDELDHGYVQHLLSGLEFYIEQALCPETNLTKCLLASPTVTDMLLTEFCHPASNTDAHHQPITNLVDTIAERSQAHGHLVAVEAPNDAITYEQLLALVPRLAWSLQQHGVNAQTRVAVLAAKNIPTIATILALWTLGAIYVPIDVQLPVDRQRYMMSTAECTTIVDASSSLGANWPDALSYTSLIEAHSIQLHFSPPIASYQYSPSDLLYIVFTSGTTGQPKGIATYFSNITNLIVQDPAHLCPTPGTRHLQTTSVSFDPCIYSTLLALYQQATLVLPGSDILTSMQHANTVLLTATLLAAMDPQDYPRLKTVISGGEALSHARFQQYTKTLESAQSTGPLVQTPQQQAMTQALCAVLEIQPSAVNLTCSFIQLGGDSISAIRLASQLRQTGYTLAIPDILQRISLDTLCDQMAPQGASATLIASELTAEALLPLTLVQEWLAKLALDHSNLPHHVITIELGRPILPSQLNTALHRLISHHSALRCKWEQVSIDQGALRVLAPPTTPQPLVDIVEADDGCWQSQLGRSARLLDIQTGSLIRAVLVTQSSEAHPLRLVLLIAKLTVDDASCPILVHDLGRALDQQRLDPVPMPYDTWVAMHRPHRQPKSPMPQLTDVTMALPTAPHCLGQPNSVQDLSTYMKPLSAKTIVTLTPTIGALPDCDVSNRDIWAMATVHALAQWSTAGPVVLWHHDTDRNAYARKGDASHTVGRLDTLYPISLQLHSDTALPLAIRQIKQTLRTAQRDRYQQAFASSFDWSTPMLCSAGCGAVLLCTREEPLDYSFGHQRVAAMVNNPIETDQNEVGSLGPWAMTITVCRIETALQLKIAYSPSVLSEASVANLVTMIRASLAAIVQCYKDASASPMQLWVPADFAQVELSLADVDDLGRVLHSHRLSMDNIDAVYPCLPLQEGLLAVTASNHTAYFVQVTMSVQGQLDVAQFQSAWNRLIAQHAILRTRFLLQPLGRRQTMLQVVLKAWQPSWTLGSWLGPETAHQEHQAHIASLTQSFDLTQPLLQLGLFTAGSQDHRLVFTIHHAMIDGWSLSLLMDNLIQQYMELEPGKPESYGSVAQHVWAQDPDISHQFWSDHFSAVTAPSYLPSPTVDAARMAALAFVPNCFETLDVAMDNGSALMDMAQQHDVTLSTVLRAALAVLLQYYSGRDQVLFGVTVSGRNVPIPGIESIIGPCINTIPCLAVITPETTVASLLAALHNASAQTVPFEHSRLTDIHRCTRIDTELALFNVLLVVQNYPESLQIASSPLAIAIDSAQQNAEYPLTLVASTKADQLHVQLTFRTDVFPVDYVRQVSRHYLATLASLVQSPPATHVHHLTLLSPAEQTLLLNTYATNPHPCPVHYAHQYFETHVHQSPNTIALRDQAQSYTYAQVHRLARGLAYTLTQNSAVGRDRTVVIVADLSAGLVIAQLAVWMSGSAFVVIDPQQPLERKQFIVADSQCVAVVGLARDSHVWPDLREATTTHTFFTPAFDAAISELWIPLSLGGTVLVNRQDHLATLSRITRLSALPRYTPPVEASVATGSLADETTDVQLLPILAQVLGKPLDAAALHQTFFQLGGNSLLAFQLVAQCRRAGLKLTIADITRTATILQLSQL